MKQDFSQRQRHVLWIMVFILLAGIQTAYSQAPTVSVNFQDASPEEIFTNLELRTPYRFLYKEDINLSTPRITLKKEGVSIDEILKDIEARTNLAFRRKDFNIAVNLKPQTDNYTKGEGQIAGRIVDDYGFAIPDEVGNYSSGLIPDHAVNEIGSLEILPLGNPDEILLRKAVNLIIGNGLKMNPYTRPLKSRVQIIAEPVVVNP